MNWKQNLIKSEMEKKAKELAEDVFTLDNRYIAIKYFFEKIIFTLKTNSGDESKNLQNTNKIDCNEMIAVISNESYKTII